jgi:glycosyltransferase involved in cell wall biosynthesis
MSTSNPTIPSQVSSSSAGSGSCGPPPAVSVIMPAYNVAEYIGSALDSVFNQTFTDYEVIVVNDGSPDTGELERVLAPYLDRILYLKQENEGLSRARNRAIGAARGRYIALLDSDDFWEPDYLSVQMGGMEGDPTIDVLYADAFIFGDSPIAGKTYMEICPSEGEVTLERLIREECHVMVSVLARREAVVRAGLFDESLRSAEDFDLWLRMVDRGSRIAYHRRPLVHYRRRHDSLSADEEGLFRSIIRVFDKAECAMRLSPDEQKALEERRAFYRAKLQLLEGKKALFQGDPKTAVSNLTEANRFLRSRKIKLALLLLRAAPGLLLSAYKLRARLSLGVGSKSL